MLQYCQNLGRNDDETLRDHNASALPQQSTPLTAPSLIISTTFSSLPEIRVIGLHGYKQLLVWSACAVFQPLLILRSCYCMGTANRNVHCGGQLRDFLSERLAPGKIPFGRPIELLWLLNARRQGC